MDNLTLMQFRIIITYGIYDTEISLITIVISHYGTHLHTEIFNSIRTHICTHICVVYIIYNASYIYMYVCVHAMFVYARIFRIKIVSDFFFLKNTSLILMKFCFNMVRFIHKIIE